jgi:chromate reductase
MYSVALIIGSLRRDSLNKKLARNLMDIGRDMLSFTLVPLDELPRYNQDLEKELPEPVARFKAAVEAADAVLFVTPEYNRGIPGVLKNALDWGSRPPGKNSWGKKPAAIAGTSPGHVGTAAAQAQLRGTLVMLNMRLAGQPEAYIVATPQLFGENGTITAESTVSFLRRFLDNFTAWIASAA